MKGLGRGDFRGLVQLGQFLAPPTLGLPWTPSPRGKGLGFSLVASDTGWGLGQFMDCWSGGLTG